MTGRTEVTASAIRTAICSAPTPPRETFHTRLRPSLLRGRRVTGLRRRNTAGRRKALLPSGCEVRCGFHARNRLRCGNLRSPGTVRQRLIRTPVSSRSAFHVYSKPDRVIFISFDVAEVRLVGCCHTSVDVAVRRKPSGDCVPPQHAPNRSSRRRASDSVHACSAALAT